VQIVLGLIALLIVAAVVVLAARGLTTYRPVQDFLATYPGEYELPDTVAPGFPVWLNWSHFLNAFFILLIIRTGWQVRTQKRPTAFWTNRWSKNARKISLTLWLHQALDILWLINGIVFVVLIFATGHWLRIVPSSWEVFPNALSALIHYLTLEWPVENGWVNYNSLQQLMYFIVVFIAAPLAALTGVRMSGIWPKNAKRLSAIYPVEVARAIHFPVMLFFVGFIIVHVALVLATGALQRRGQLDRVRHLRRLTRGHGRRLDRRQTPGRRAHRIPLRQGLEPVVRDEALRAGPVRLARALPPRGGRRARRSRRGPRAG
jgi:thiosulfate reductase cytochrome b subunit